jgi:hypothetical protein
MFLWGRFWFRRIAYGYTRMSSLVPELVKKRCKTINAESTDSANVRSSLLMNNYKAVSSANFLAIAPSFGGSFAAAAA